MYAHLGFPHLRSIKAVLVLSLTAVCGLNSCSSDKSRIEIETEPQGAEISTLAGEKIGVSPLTLEGEALAKFAQKDRIALEANLPGYVKKQMSFDLHGRDRYVVHMNALDENYFSDRLITEYPRQINALVAELLRVQGLLVVNRLDEAETALTAFQKKFPSVAASYVLQANIAESRGQSQQARGYLLRARTLDAGDPVVNRMLSNSPVAAEGVKK
jgi:hypothetical protein